MKYFPTLFLLSGIPKLITSDMVKEGAAVIDVGINYVHDPVTGKTKLVGDVDFEGNKLSLFRSEANEKFYFACFDSRKSTFVFDAGITTLLIIAPLSSEGQECNHSLISNFPSSLSPPFLPLFLLPFFSSFLRSFFPFLLFLGGKYNYPINI